MKRELSEIEGPIRIIIRLDFDHQDMLDFIYRYVKKPIIKEYLRPFNFLVKCMDDLLESGYSGDEISDYAYEYVDGLGL
jgi:hypothetical protein